MPAGEWPHSFSVKTGCGLELSHSENCSVRQYQHEPQATTDPTTTRSPTEIRRTSGPVSTTSPMNSWPRMSPSRMAGR